MHKISYQLCNSNQIIIITMKKLIYLFVFALIASTTFVGCDDDDDSSSPFKTVTLGAQLNTEIDGFYSMNEDKTYPLTDAAQNQSKIDLLCFYEEGKNDISLASPGANITDIFTGDNDPVDWAVKDTTWFHQVDENLMTVAAFDALSESDVIIETLFDEENKKRKAKLLQPGDIYAFQNEDNQYGLFKVVTVTQGEAGSVQFTYILKK